MKIDDTSMTAGMRAQVRGGVASMAAAALHGGRRGVVICVLACASVAAIAPAQGQDRGGFRKDDQGQSQPQQRDQRDERPAQRQDIPRFDQRDLRDQRASDDARRQQQERNADVPRPHSGRLTPDERRDLRRQINEAGVDLYPNTPRR
jgi:hypothetical protein